MNKRPALLKEARWIVQRAKAMNSIQWTERSVNWISDLTQLVAASVRKDKVTIIQFGQFATTEFVGSRIKKLICDRSLSVTEELPYHLENLRVFRVKRNGHEVWRVVLVEVRKGKEYIVD